MRRSVSLCAPCGDPRQAAPQTPRAQPRTPPRKPAEQPRRPAARRGRLLTIRGVVDGGYQSLLARDSFEAVLGKAAGPFFGGGAQVVFRPGLFVEVNVSRYRDAGERVFRTAGGQIFRLGIPTTVTITPVEITGGYRFRRLWRVVPYAGGGVGSVGYREVSSFATGDENVGERFGSYHAAAGGEVVVWRRIAVAGEVLHRRVPDAIGENGLSKEFGETDLGGTSVQVKTIVRIW